MDVRNRFRSPFVLTLFLACAFSLVVTVTWRRMGSRDEASWVQVESYRQAPEVSVSPGKYFHEPTSLEPGGDADLNHYDQRFFRSKVEHEDKRNIQVHMVRAYLDTFSRLGLETWIAHGTLLGWWWNQSMLPWDWDIDSQVSEATLHHMANTFNNTYHDYTTTIGQDNQPTKRTYLLDVNPHGVERENGDGLNIIDARWIDVDNGLYVDITALSELHPVEHPGIVSCKNFHDYHVEDLYPLEDTEFESVAAKVPAAYEKLLVEEYGEKSLILTEYEGHRWDPLTRLWMKSSISTKAEDNSTFAGEATTISVPG